MQHYLANRVESDNETFKRGIRGSLLFGGGDMISIILKASSSNVFINCEIEISIYINKYGVRKVMEPCNAQIIRVQTGTFWTILKGCPNKLIVM